MKTLGRMMETDLNLIKISGKATHCQTIPKGDKEMYFFEIEGKTFSGWGKCPVLEGDTITFKYEVKPYNGVNYNNVKYIYNVSETHIEPTIKDYQEVKKMAQNDYKKEFALLMKASVDLAITKQNLDEKEIFSQFNRFLKACCLEEEWLDNQIKQTESNRTEKK